MKLKRGTRIRTTYEYSQTGTVMAYVEIPAQGKYPALPDWYRIKYDDGTKGCCHRSMFNLSN